MDGMLAGLISATLLHPLDVIKTQTQVSKKSLTSCIKSIYQLSGIKGYWRGCGYNIAISPTFYGIYFYTYNLSTNRKSKYNNPLINGITASLLGGFVVNPFYVLKTRAQNKEYIKPITRINHYYRGFGLTAIKTPEMGIQMYIYEKLYDYNILIAIIISKIIASTITYPIDVFRTKQRTFNTSFKENMFKLIMVNLSTNTFKKIYKGYTVHAISSVIRSSLVFSLYELFKRKL